MAAMSADRVVKYIAVARLSDHVIACSHVQQADPTVNYDERVEAVLKRGKWGSVSSHLLIHDGSNAIHLVTGTDKRVYFCITSSSYPQRFVVPSGSGSSDKPTLLGEVRSMVEGPEFADLSLTCGRQGLGRTARGRLAKIAATFNNLEEIDSMTRVRGKLDEVKGAMSENISLALNNLDAAKDAEERSAGLRESADRFKRDARTVEHTMRCRAWKWNALIALLIIGVLCAIIIPIAVSAS